MRRSRSRVKVVRSTAIALIVAYLMLDATRAVAQAPPDIQNPQIEIAYLQPGNTAYQPIHDRLKQRLVLEQLKQFLAPLRLPRRLVVNTDQCDAATRHYQPQGPVTICYELVAQIERIAAKADPDRREVVIVGSVVQAVFHEVAQAVFDMLQVPIWGRRKDAADQLGAFIMLQFSEEVALQTIMGTATFFQLSGRTWTGSDLADVNAPEAQRFFNFLCMAFGASPKSFEFLVTPGPDGRPMLPEKRAIRCSAEYASVRKAFNLRIMPHVDADLLIRVRAAQWLTPGDRK